MTNFNQLYLTWYFHHYLSTYFILHDRDYSFLCLFSFTFQRFSSLLNRSQIYYKFTTFFDQIPNKDSNGFFPIFNECFVQLPSIVLSLYFKQKMYRTRECRNLEDLGDLLSLLLCNKSIPFGKLQNTPIR